MKIEFVNGTELIVPEFTDPIDVAKTYSTISDIGKEFAKFAPENVSVIKAYDDDGALIAQFDGMYFGGVRIENLATDNGVKFEAHFTFRQKTQMEIMAEQIAALQESQNLQDGAIEDLADTVYA
jgi:hypothetical protein